MQWNHKHLCKYTCKWITNKLHGDFTAESWHGRGDWLVKGWGYSPPFMGRGWVVGWGGTPMYLLYCAAYWFCQPRVIQHLSLLLLLLNVKISMHVYLHFYPLYSLIIKYHTSSILSGLHCQCDDILCRFYFTLCRQKFGAFIKNCLETLLCPHKHKRH